MCPVTNLTIWSSNGVEIMCGGILPRTVLAQYRFVFDLKHFRHLSSIPSERALPEDNFRYSGMRLVQFIAHIF